MKALKIATVATTLAIGLTTQQAQAQSIFPNLFNWGGQTQLTNNNICGPNGCATPAANQTWQCAPNTLPAYPLQNGTAVQNWSTGRPDYLRHNHPQGIVNGPPRNRLDHPNQNQYRIQPYPQNSTFPQNYNSLPYNNLSQIPGNSAPTYDPRFPAPMHTNYYMNSNVPQQLPVGYGQSVPNL